MQTLPVEILPYFEPFRVIFLTQKTYLKAVLLLFGALMCRGGRTICSILRVVGLKGETTFSKYHNVLNRSGWDILKGSKILLDQITKDSQEPLKIVVDGHLERRKGPKITSKGHYRDAAQSSDNYTVISSGIKWLSFAVLKQYSWFTRKVALPFLTVLVPSEDGNKKMNRRHKTLHDWTRQAVLQIRKWYPHREIILVADSEFATAETVKTCSRHNVSFVSRLKLNARLYDFPFEVKIGRPRNKGLRLPTAEERINNPYTAWELTEVAWYGNKRKITQYLTGTCLWHVMSHSNTPMKIRYVLMTDPLNKFKPILLMSSDESLNPIEIIETYVTRWNIEVTFHEAREHLGIETQRQWSDRSILRSTPILFGLYSLVFLIGEGLINNNKLKLESTAWYTKSDFKFSDILSSIRRCSLEGSYFCKQQFPQDPCKT